MLMKKICLLFTALMTLLSTSALAQTIEVSGLVTDQSDSPVIGATVMVEGTKTGTSTDAAGAFKIKAPSDGTLVFSIIGYAQQSVKINGRKFIEVKLAEDSEYLEDAIVVGYGTGQKIGNIVGSVTTVSASDIAAKPSANVSDALQLSLIHI